MTPEQVESQFGSIPECYIDSLEDLEAFVKSVPSDESYAACSIDTEADSMHSYETKLCLIQFSMPGQLAIIDPLALSREDLEVLIEFVDRFEIVWMHGADYDISLFNETFDWVPRKIWDTQFAARFIGKEKFGLANLLDDEYGVVVSKQSQKADWSRRPLSEKMLAYAYNDVRYLLDLGAKYVSELHKIGRYEWFCETCDFARTSVMNRTGKSQDDVWRVTGWGKLSSKGLHFLRALWLWRDGECKILDRPAFKFLGNAELLKMAEALENGREAKPPHYIRSQPAARLRDAMAVASEVDSSEYPVKRKRGNGLRLEIDDKRFDALRAHRNKVAAELEVEPTMIATRTVLEKLASTNLDKATQLEGIMSWQRELLGLD